jgi:hypothetical protein
METKRVETNNTLSKHDFAARDSKGRAIGARIRTYTVDFVPATEEEVKTMWTYQTEPGTRFFCFRAYATRNDVEFNALHPERQFATPEARDKAIITYLRGAQTRADK